MNKFDAHIRLMIRRDMPEVIDIEYNSYPNPWSEDEFMKCLRIRNVMSYVSEREGQITGFMIFELFKHKIELIDLATHHTMRRIGVGSQLAQKLIDKLSSTHKNIIIADVRETNLVAQKFFSSLGFIADEVLHGIFCDADESAYRFKYRYGWGTTIEAPDYGIRTHH